MNNERLRAETNQKNAAAKLFAFGAGVFLQAR
jgi:hypothetical protein